MVQGIFFPSAFVTKWMQWPQASDPSRVVGTFTVLKSAEQNHSPRSFVT